MVWELGDWLPITWIPATEDEIDYMKFCRKATDEKNEKYLEMLRKKYNVTETS